MTQLSAVGIDLGTTYSAVAIVNAGGVPEIIPNSENERLTPSVVYFADDAVLVGQDAKNAASTIPEQVVQFVKRQMGEASWFFLHGGQRFSAVDVSALILKKLRQDAEQRLGLRIPYAVITVPAYFDEHRRRQTRSAAEIAGIEVLQILNEPTAAAVAYRHSSGAREGTVLVYDLGGGTFDVTIMRVQGQEISVVATGGHHSLGGKDFDDAVISFTVDQFRRQHGFDPTQDALDAAEIRSFAEQAKRELSKRGKALIVVRAGGRTSRIEINRDQFDALIKPKIETTLGIVRNTLREASLTSEKVDSVVLVGGSTRIPAVRAALTQLFGKALDESVNPDEAVALGAAILAAKELATVKPQAVPQSVQDVVGGLQITDVTSHTFGIESLVPGTQQKHHTHLIKKNSPIPTSVSREFTTSIPNQTAIAVAVLQGEFEDPALCTPIGQFTMSGLPPNRPAGRKVRVTFSCTKNGEIEVTGEDIETGITATTTVNYRVGSAPSELSAKQRWLNQQRVE